MSLDYKELQQVIQPTIDYLNKQCHKSSPLVLLTLAINADELELNVIEIGASEEQYRILGTVKQLIGTGELLNQIILDKVITYISQAQEYQVPLLENIVEIYSIVQEDLNQIMDEELGKFLKELKRQVDCIKYILSYFDQMRLEILPNKETLCIDRAYFEKDILEELDLGINIKEGIAKLIQEMNKQYDNWGIDEILLIGRDIQIPYIKQIIIRELISRGVANNRIFDASEEEQLYIILRDLFHLSSKVEEEIDKDKLPKIIYQGRTYEYVKKERNYRTNKEEITLRYGGKAIERYPADKEKYFKFLERDIKKKMVIDFQVAVLDEEMIFNQLNDEIQLHEILKLKEIGEEKFLNYFSHIQELLDNIKLNNKIRYIVMITSTEKYIKYVSSIQQISTEVEFLHIKINNSQIEVEEIKQEEVPGNPEEEKKEESQSEKIDSESPERSVRVQYEVEFNGGYYAYFTEYYQVDYINLSKYLMEEKYIRQLKPDDQVIFIDNMQAYNKNIIMYIVECVINNSEISVSMRNDYKLFMQWKKELERYIDHHGYEVEQIAILLDEKNVHLTPQAISQWLPDGRTIAPQSEKSLLALIDIIGSKELERKKYLFYNASKHIRKLHTYVKQLVEEIILRGVTDRHYHSTGTTKVVYEVVKDFKSYSKILEVKSIKRINRNMKVSQVNKILKY